MIGTTTKSLKPIRLENLLTFEKTISERTFHGQTFAIGRGAKSDVRLARCNPLGRFKRTVDVGS